METGGIIFMILGWGMAFTLLGFCLYRVMKAGGADFNKD